MHRRSAFTLAAGFLIGSCFSPAHADPVKATEGQELLDKLLRWPGSYGQICDAIALPSPIPLPAFRVQTLGEATFSQKNLTLMKEKRSILVPALRERLKQADFDRKEEVQSNDPAIEGESDGRPWGADPRVFSTLLLQTVRETRAVEALPELLDIEARLHERLQLCLKDPKAPVPRMDAFGGAGIYPAAQANQPEGAPEKDEATVDRERQVFLAEAAHRDVLAMMGYLLRFVGYKPILNSPLEKAYAKGLKTQYDQHEDLHAYKSKKDIPDEEQEWIGFDQLHKLPHYKWEHVEIPYNDELRGQMRAWVTDYLKPKAEGKGKKKP